MLYEDSYRNMSVAIRNGNAAEMLHARAGPVDPDQRRPHLTCGEALDVCKSPSHKGVREAVSPSRTSFSESDARRPAFQLHGPRCLELRGDSEEECVAERWTDELDADRQPGRPSSGAVAETAGWPVTLNAAVNGVNCAAGSNCSTGRPGSGLPADVARAACASVGVSSRS